MCKADRVPARAKQAETTATEMETVARPNWTKRMLAALGNGVKGSERFVQRLKAQFAASGFFTETEARMLASQPR